MRKIGFLMLAVIFLLPLLASAEQFLQTNPSKYVDAPTFIGFVPDEFIVVLKDNVTIDHQKDMRAGVALSDLSGFTQLAQKYGVVRLRPQFPGSDRITTAAAEQARVLSRYYKVRFDQGTLYEAMDAYRANPLVDHVEPIGIHAMYATPNDTYYDDPPSTYPYDQWHYWDTYGIDADLAWDSKTGDATVVVGILDSGVKYDHGDLGGSNPPGPNDVSTNGNIWINDQEIVGNGIDDDGNGYVDDVIGWDFVERTDWYSYACTDLDCGGVDNDPFDGNGHGTHVAGTVAAITNNGYAVAGIAGGWGDGTFTGTVANGVKLIPCRIGYTMEYRQSEVGVVIMDYCAEAMYYMANLKQRGVNVAAINCSWGSSNTGGLGAAVDYLLAQDVMIMVAAGNSNTTSADYLGSREDCMDIGATDDAGAAASFTNYGTWVDIAAPGVGILSTTTDKSDPTADYIAAFDGTSMASPHVAGVAALLEAYNPSLSAQDKWDILVSTTTPYSGSKYIGTGIVNAKNAIDAAGPNTNPPVADFSGTPTSGDAPLTVQFTDLSTNSPTSWACTFGDGGTSAVQNPSHTYTSAGTYTVTLTATNAYGSDAETKTGYITVTVPQANPPVAGFSGTPTSGLAPLAVQFTDLSTNAPTSWAWTFGDGGTSAVQNPSHTYTAAGTYTVSLTATNAYGSDTETKTGYITVTEPQTGTMHVQNIEVTRVASGRNCTGYGTIVIYDSNNQPVANATVYVTVTGNTSGSGSATTGTDGSVTFSTSKVKTCSGEWCFEVTNVTHASLTYDSGANLVTKACESGWVYSFEGQIASAEPIVPNAFELRQNYPNPFNPTTEISFTLPTATNVKLEVFNITGQLVETLANSRFDAGVHAVTWDASGRPSGIYLYRLVTDDRTVTRKMILLK